MRLKDKNVIVTGGAGAIGSAVVRRFLEEGASVLVVDYNEDAVKSMLKDLKKANENVSGYIADFIDTTAKIWDKTMSINLRGTFLVSREVSKVMVKNNYGTIINMSSTNGILGEEGLAAYNASKAGIILLSKTMALELAKYNIRVNSVCPGWIRTKLQDVSGLPKEIIESYLSKIPLGRAGNPLEVANIFVFLASDESSFITGTEIVIDGGQICKE